MAAVGISRAQADASVGGGQRSGGPGRGRPDGATPRPGGSRRWSAGTIALVAAMCAVSAVLLYPFWFMINTSFKTQQQFDGAPGHSVASWSKLVDAIPVGRELLNSVLVCVLAIIVILAVSSLAGFAFAKLKYRFATLVFLGLVSAMLIPIQSIMIPAYVNLAKLHLVTGYTAAVFMYAALGTPFATFLMTTYFRSLPDELVEAAVVDGCGYLKTFTRIALPLAGPALVTVTVLQFIQIWDDLLVGLLFLQDPVQRPITVGLAVLASGRTTDVPVLMAGSIVSALPAIVVYLIFQRRLVSGLTAGVTK
ncbi:MAG: carbohydrate ABC transporter permease [Actinobacteria bacterium]|jgi:multiple sugar transport system permease protein/raffinose/stachyose/melibiose transport system permease protein|nr:carbohydrate ABC transporter permease [Actinomycetota bacterium]